MTHPLLYAQHVQQYYGTRLALDLEHFSLLSHEVVGIRGHNGCGKSTFMRILAFLEKPSSGIVHFNNTIIWDEPVRVPPSQTLRQKMCAWWRQTIAKKPAQPAVYNHGIPVVPRREHDFPTLRRQVTLLMQQPYLLARSVEYNVGFGLLARGEDVAQQERYARICSALESVGLEPQAFLQRRRHELSGGEAQRVALAARLILRPRVLLMDEPTTGVDAESVERIAVAIRNAQQNNTAVIVVSHDQDWLETVATRIIHLKHGRLLN